MRLMDKVRPQEVARHAQFYSRSADDQPDLAAVVEIIQAVSSEIDLEKLVGTLMVTALECAGGDRCVLVLKHGSTWIEAEAKAIDEGLSVDLRRTRVLRRDLPQDILRYVVATPGGLTLNDDAALQISDGELIRIYESQSVLCLPMSKQQRLIGLLYFESRSISRGTYSGSFGRPADIGFSGGDMLGKRSPLLPVKANRGKP